jgi:lipopolysaccharide biosynthesis glycosyltransferase
MPAAKTMDIVLCADRLHFTGMLAVVNSVISNTDDPEAVSFHLTVGVGESDELLTSIRRWFPNPSFRYEVREFYSTPFLEEYIEVAGDRRYGAVTSMRMNFSRFYLGQIYPDLGKFLYLDADVIAQGDIAELFRLPALEKQALAAVRSCSFGTWEGGFDETSDHLKNFDFEAPVFNAGIYVTDLEQWRNEEILAVLEGWMKVQSQAPEDIVFGTQSIMNLAFYRKVQILPPEWNVRHLGDNDNIPKRDLREGKILHWAGPRKPWVRDGLYKEYWNKYVLESPDLEGGP